MLLLISRLSLLLTFFTIACSDTPELHELQKFAATETYPDDDFLNNASNKKALIIVAHDDDDCAMAGTIAKLSSQGWQIIQLSLSSHMMDGSNKNPASIICMGNEVLLLDKPYRKGLDTIKNPWLPIPYSDIQTQFYTDDVAQEIMNKVGNFKPSVIFTLDNVKGGYGHPEHIFISQLVLDLYKNGQLKVDRIYQSVYTDHMEKEIVDTWLQARMEKWGYPNASTIANEMYNIDGMPDPNVQLYIQEHAETKMKYLRAYPESVRKNFRKFIPYYEEFTAKEYFSVFDREFFRVISDSSMARN